MTATDEGVPWPLTGRAPQVAAIREALRLGQGIVLSGPSGVGKSRLAREALGIAAADGANVQWALATHATSNLPFSAVAHLVPPSTGPPRDALAMFQVAAGALRARSGDRRLVLGVDDAHLLDEGSAGLVLHLAASGVASVVVTVRSGARCPDPIVALWKDQLARRLEVQALTLDEVRLLLESVLGGSLERTTLRQLFDVTQGNPLFLRELVRAAKASGSLLEVRDAWRWDGSVLFPALADLVRSRMDALPDGERHVLELAAVGEPLPVDLLAACTSEDDMVATDRAGLLAVEERGGEQVASLVHPLYGEVLRGTMAATVRRARHRRLCDALSSTPSSSVDRLRLASWSLDAGLPVGSELLVEAADAASAVFDHVTSARLASAAVRSDSGLPAALSLAAALRGLNRAGEAEDLLAQREPMAAQSPAALEYLATRTEVLVGDLGRIRRALELLDRARGWATGQDWQQTVTALSLNALLLAGCYEQILREGETLLRDPTCRPATRLRAIVPVGLALVESGRLGAATTLADEAMQLAASAAEEFPSGMRAAVQIRLAVMICCGQWRDVEPLAEWYYEDGSRLRAHEVLGPGAFLLGLVQSAYGAMTPARQWLSEALGHLEVRDVEGHLAPCLARLAQVTAQSGDAAAAIQLLERAEEVAARRPEERQRVTELGWAAAWVLAASGDLPGARARALREAAEHSERPFVRATLLHEALRLRAPAAELLQPLTDLARVLDSPLPEVFAEHARVLAASDGLGLEQVSRRLEDLTMRLLAAEAAAEAADAHRRAGDAAGAGRAAASLERLRSGCEGAQTLELLHLAAPRSARAGDGSANHEQQVADLAARGFTNRQIAAELYISRHTVDYYLRRIFKLHGVRSRTELAHALGYDA